MPAKRWATLALADAEDVTSPALEAWFTQVARVQLEELPQALHQSTSDELEKWPARVYQTLGEMRWVLDEVAHQQRQLDEGRWTQAAAEAAWLNLLAAHGGVNDRHERTARMLSFEVDYLISMKKANVSGGWAEFLQGLPAEDKFGKRCPPGDSACRTYLAHPVEIMARSFEVSFHRNTPIWLAVGDRPNAGMIWPLAPEAAYLAQGWFSTLGLLVPWWESKKKISETSRAKPVP